MPDRPMHYPAPAGGIYTACGTWCAAMWRTTAREFVTCRSCRRTKVFRADGPVHFYCPAHGGNGHKGTTCLDCPACGERDRPSKQPDDEMLTAVARIAARAGL